MINNANCLLTIEQMAHADAAAIAAGVAGENLMEKAGAAVATAVLRQKTKKIAVLCGPGNNGGDGFVAARLLLEAGKDVRVGLFGREEFLQGSTKDNADRWGGIIENLSPDVLIGCDCVVDAIFGAGLSRDIEGMTRKTIESIGKRYCVAVDVPSGIHGDTGMIMGVAHKAQKTITFFKPKLGHMVFPGREFCGDLDVIDIGIPDTVLDDIEPTHWRNSPSIWPHGFPWPKHDDHKYSRGHVVIVGGADDTGAARLSVKSAMRAGAGIVSVTTPTEAAVIYKLTLTGAIVKPVRDTGAFCDIIEEPRVAACLIGPGSGINGATREKTLAILRNKLPVVLDADALSVFENNRDLLFSSIQGPCLLTPHEGEYKRLFDFTGDKISRARAAANISGATIILKGADTVIAAPDGRVAINDNAPSTLSTAGSGDVLAGFSVAMLARGLSPFEAACIAVWLHGESARSFGQGLIAEDLPDALPGVLDRLLQMERFSYG